MEQLLKEIGELKNKLEELKISGNMIEAIIKDFINVRSSKMPEITSRSMPRYISKK
jgi:hypothetical protein|nr:MAG TPA: hypothetical protein [Caudoviricetes sp.]